MLCSIRVNLQSARSDANAKGGRLKRPYSMNETKMTPSEQQAQWNDIMGQMCAYVDDTNADVDMAYDWVCEMLNIDSFVDNKTAWDSFYETWESCDNRNDLNTFQIV